MEYKVNLVWDNDAAVWVATSDDVPGLVLESGSYDALIEKVKVAIPELMELNGKGDHDIWYSPITKRNITVDGKIKSRFTANAIMKQAGIDYHF